MAPINQTNTSKIASSTTTPATSTTISSEELMSIWMICAISIGAYLLLAMVLFFTMMRLRGKQKQSKAKGTANKLAGTVRPKGQLQRKGSTTKTAKEKPVDSSDLVCTSTPIPMPSDLRSNDILKRKELHSGSLKKKRPKFFVDEDVTQELTMSLRSAPEKDYVQTAYDDGSSAGVFQILPDLIEIMSPPSSFSGTETVPQTETLSATQRSSSRHLDSKGRYSSSETTTSSNRAPSSSTLTPSHGTSSSSSSSSWSSSSGSRSSSSRTVSKHGQTVTHTVVQQSEDGHQTVTRTVVNVQQKKNKTKMKG